MHSLLIPVSETQALPLSFSCGFTSSDSSASRPVRCWLRCVGMRSDQTYECCQCLEIYRERAKRAAHDGACGHAEPAQVALKARSQRAYVLPLLEEEGVGVYNSAINTWGVHGCEMLVQTGSVLFTAHWTASRMTGRGIRSATGLPELGPASSTPAFMSLTVRSSPLRSPARMPPTPCTLA